jgi:hypothetical protein
MKNTLRFFKKITPMLALAAMMMAPIWGWGQTTVSYSFSQSGAVTGFNEASPGIPLDANIGFGSFKNGGTTNPAINSGQLRLYQHTTKGGSIKIYASNGVTITKVVVFAASSGDGAGPAGYSVDNTTEVGTFSGGGTMTMNVSATSYVEFYNKGNSSSTRTYVNSFEVTYTTGGTPDIVLANNGTQVAASDVNQGATAHVLHKFALDVTTANASLTGMTCTTAGTYAAADITNLKVRYSADATLDGADATLSTYTNPGAAGGKTFPSFNTRTINAGSTGYIFITADIAAGATHNNTISVDAITTTNLTFASGNKSGSTTAGGAQTFKDVTNPTVTTYSPTDGNAAVTVNQNLILNFSENVQVGSAGNFVIYNSDASEFESIPYNDPRITFSTNTVTINPTETFNTGAAYYVQMPATLIRDMAGNYYAGISTTTTWNFTTVAPAVTNVTSPNADGTYKIGDLITVTVAFNGIVNVTGSPYILLKMVGTNRQAAYASGSGTSTLNFTYTIQTSDATADLDYVATTSLALNGGTINSPDGVVANRTLATPGTVNSLGYNKAIVIDGVGPTVSVYSPTDGNSSVTINQNLILTFNENVKVGTSGSIVIYNSGGTVFETIPYDDGRITFSTSTVTIDPASAFAYSSEYYVQTTGSPITDMYDNEYAGISNATTWNFTTVCTSVSTFPYTQDFESASLPLCWNEELVTGTNSWQFITGNGGSNPATAHGGTINACLKNSSSTSDITKLVMPVFDLSSISSPILSFWHTQALYSPDQDELRVYYKTTSGGSWTMLAAFTSDVPSWTRRQINLPNPGSTYFIAFEGTAQYGYGVCIDDITLGEVTGEPQNHITNLLSATGTPAYNIIDLVWDDATGNPLPDGYLIKGSTVGFSSIDNPVDGTEEVDGTLVKNVGTGVESYSFTNLTPLTTYYFKVFPFTNSGSNINYKINGEVSQTSSATEDGPCLTESFDVNALPEGWSQTSVTFTSNYAEFAAQTGSLAMVSTGNANTVNFTLTRTSNTSAKSLIVEVSTTSQSTGFTTVATFDHSNTLSGNTTICSVDLSAYSSNSTLYIQFRKVSSTTSPWRLDDITVNCGELTIWTGATNYVWEMGTNWTNGPPSSGQSALIKDVTNDPTLATSVECFNLTINSGAMLGIASAGSLKVNGTLTNTAIQRKNKNIDN